MEGLTVGAIIEAYELLENDPEERGFRLLVNDDRYHGGTVFREDGGGRMVWTDGRRSHYVDNLGRAATSGPLSDVEKARRLADVLRQDIVSSAGAAFRP